MTEPSGIEERPLKRARLDPTSSASEATFTEDLKAPPSSATEISKAPIKPATTIDEDLEREIRAGITEYVCPDNLGFTGVLKQRYTDFQVNEILLNGEVLHLRTIGVERKEKKRSENRTTQKEEVKGGEDVDMKDATKDGENGQIPTKQDAIAAVEHERRADGEEEAGEAFQISNEDRQALHSIFGEDITSQVVSLAKSIRKHSHWKAKDFAAITGPPITDKDQRTLAHRELRRIFPDLLESAMEPDQSIRIKARPPAQRGSKRKRGKEQERDRDPDRRSGKLVWEERGGEYLHFTLYKENKDTMEVTGFLGSMTGGGPKSYSFAGTKDRRACTVQRVCVKRQSAERLASIGERLFSGAVGDFEYKHHDISLGDLGGNEFVISLRDCHFQKEDGLNHEERVRSASDVLTQAVKDFSEKGFINYYGLQRFGSFSASTDAIGIKLLQGNLKGAVDDILAYSPVALAAAEITEEGPPILISQDDKARAQGIHHWKACLSGTSALDMIPRKFIAERNIIQHLSSKNKKTRQYDRTEDWQGALMTIPRNLRLMYVHAYQSLVWNVVAGKRWTMFGDAVVEGDLVLVHEHKDKEEESGHASVPDTVDQDGEMIINPSGADSSLQHDDAFERARPLSKAEAESGKYTIFDIVLPQPGFDVEYPRNRIGDYYKEFMGSEKGGRLDPYNMRRGWREVSLSGGYRKFIARPLQPITFEIREYVKCDEQLVETDLQRLQKESNGHVETEDGEVEAEAEDEKKIAVILKMQLGSSQYATMALRELMKAGGVKAFKPEFVGGR